MVVQLARLYCKNLLLQVRVSSRELDNLIKKEVTDFKDALRNNESGGSGQVKIKILI